MQGQENEIKGDSDSVLDALWSWWSEEDGLSVSTEEDRGLQEYLDDININNGRGGAEGGGDGSGDSEIVNVQQCCRG